MAVVNAESALDSRTINFSWYNEYYVDGYNYPDSNEVIDGVIYRDTTVIYANDSRAGLELGLQYSGEILFGGDGWAISGIVRQLMEYEWNSGDLLWSIADIEISALSLENSIRTTDLGDEQSLIRAALRGNDDISLSNEDDWFDGQSGSDIIRGWGGFDTLYGNLGDDTLDGGDDSDILYGDDGADLLEGSTGRDWMTGGADADTFYLASRYDSSNRNGQIDVVTDFRAGVDTIDVSAIDASTIKPGGNAFVWRGEGAITRSAVGEIRFQRFDHSGTDSDYTMVYFDMDRDSASEFKLMLSGLVSLTAEDFAL